MLCKKKKNRRVYSDTLQITSLILLMCFPLTVTGKFTERLIQLTHVCHYTKAATVTTDLHTD